MAQPRSYLYFKILSTSASNILFHTSHHTYWFGYEISLSFFNQNICFLDFLEGQIVAMDMGSDDFELPLLDNSMSNDEDGGSNRGVSEEQS